MNQDDKSRPEAPPDARRGLREDATPGAGLALLGLMLVLTALPVYLAQPPRPVPASAPATAFSAERAMKLSREFAVEPRPAGTAALERARDYLVGQLRAIGAEAEVQEALVVRGRTAHTVQNVLGRVPGAAHARSFVMTAHYDSVHGGPGAADDGAGVVAMLETARALKAGPPLRNDVILVFTGDEERGQRGIVAFTEHAWARNAGIVLGFEARGVRGPANMFETSPGNAGLIRELVRSGAPARANSLMYELHRRTPNATDFGLIKGPQYPGYNLAFVGGLGYYHTANDTPANLSPASIQHLGECALALARHFGNFSAEQFRTATAAGGDAVYFNTLGPHLARYPAAWSRYIAALAAGLYLAALGLGFGRRRLSLRGLLLGATAFLLAVALGAAVAGLLAWIAYQARGVYMIYNDPAYVLAFLGVTLAVAAPVYAAFGVKVRPLDLLAGSLTWLLIGLALMEWKLPMGSYTTAWPLLFSSAGLIAWCQLPWREADPGAPAPPPWASPLPLAAMTVSALPAFLMIGPGIQGAIDMGTSLLSVVWLPFVVLLVGLLAPQVVFIMRALAGSGQTRAQRRWFPALAGAAGLLIYFAGLGTNGFSATKPRMNGVSYRLDLDARQAWWISNDRELDEWTSQFFPPPAIKPHPDQQGPRWQAPAPLAPMAGPQLEVVADRMVAGARELTLRLASPRKVPEAGLRVAPPAEVLSAAVNGSAIEGGKDWSVQFGVFPGSGVIELTLKVIPAGGPLAVTVEEKTFDLRDAPAFRPRPSSMIPRPNTIDWFESSRLPSDCTYVTRTFRLPAPPAPAP